MKYEWLPGYVAQNTKLINYDERLYQTVPGLGQVPIAKVFHVFSDRTWGLQVYEKNVILDGLATKEDAKALAMVYVMGTGE